MPSATRRSTSFRSRASPTRSATPSCPAATARWRPATSRRSPPAPTTRRPPISSCNGSPRRRCRWCARCCPIRCAIPIACRPTSRTQYRALWPAAKDYLINLCECANSGVVDMIMPGWQDYALSIDRMCTAVWGGQDPKSALAEGGGRVGCDHPAARRRRRRRRPTRSSCKIPGCYADHTIEKLGQAVHIT